MESNSTKFVRDGKKEVKKLYYSINNQSKMEKFWKVVYRQHQRYSQYLENNTNKKITGKFLYEILSLLLSLSSSVLLLIEVMACSHNILLSICI